MPRSKNSDRNRTLIPVLWDNECRSIPIAIRIVNGIRKMAALKGYSVQLYENCEALLRDGKASPNVVVVGFESDRMPLLLHTLVQARRRIVITSMDSDHIDAHYSCATFSRRIATDQMLEFLLEKGCRSFAMVGCGEHSVNDIVHMDAMESFVLQNRQTYGRSFQYHHRIEESFEAFLPVCSQFDAVLCPNDFAAVAMLRFCEEHGLSVPRDFLLASFKDNFISHYCRPSITSLSVDFFAIGENAVVVWRFLQDITNDELQMRITVPGCIMERESTDVTVHVAQKPCDFEPPQEPYEGGPFYSDPVLKTLMRVERCLQSCDELDIRIIGLLLSDLTYEEISAKLFLGESSLQYRIRKIFRVAQVENRRGFTKMLNGCFTKANHFDQVVLPVLENPSAKE